MRGPVTRDALVILSPASRGRQRASWPRMAPLLSPAPALPGPSRLAALPGAGVDMSRVPLL